MVDENHEREDLHTGTHLKPSLEWVTMFSLTKNYHMFVVDLFSMLHFLKFCVKLHDPVAKDCWGGNPANVGL